MAVGLKKVGKAASPCSHVIIITISLFPFPSPPSGPQAFALLHLSRLTVPRLDSD